MGRPRKDPKDNHLPPRVTKNKYSYVWKPKGTKLSVTLGKIRETSISKLWERYEEEKAKQHDVMTFSKLWNMFLGSPTYTDLAPRTQKDYRQHQKQLLAVFGKMRADDIKIEQVRIFMDRRGLSSKNQANQEVASMSRVFGWGYERGYVKGNPCKGIRKFTLKAREVYITDEEYQAIYENAAPALRAGMEIAYLCAARVSDILSLRWSQVSEAGIYFQQGKTGIKQIKAWTVRLHEAIELAKTLGGETIVICSSKGTKYSKSGFNDLWEAARESAGLMLGKKMDCTFHDLKAKGISDYEGSSKEKQIFSGHKTESQVVVYDRKVKSSPTLDRAPVIKTAH
jgi:integrase